MDRSAMRTIGLAAVTVLIATFVAKANVSAAHEAGGTVASDTAAGRDSAVDVHWLNDANILALYGAVNSRQIAAASAELQAWRSDTVRALASSVAQQHSALQHSADSLAAAIRLVPVMSALVDSLNAVIQAPDSLHAYRGGSLDRAFVQQQVAAQQRIASYLQQLSTLAQAPELQALLQNAADRVSAEVSQTRAVQAGFAIADSVVADSLARRAARRNRQTTNR